MWGHAQKGPALPMPGQATRTLGQREVQRLPARPCGRAESSGSWQVTSCMPTRTAARSPRPVTRGPRGLVLHDSGEAHVFQSCSSPSPNVPDLCGPQACPTPASSGAAQAARLAGLASSLGKPGRPCQRGGAEDGAGVWVPLRPGAAHSAGAQQSGGSPVFTGREVGTVRPSA